MIIKKYIQFIKEDKMGFNSIGEWIETLSDDDYVMNIVNRYLREISPDIDLANAVNLLDEREQADIKSQVQKYLDGGIEEKDPIVLTSTRTANIINHRNGTSNVTGVGSVGNKLVGESVDTSTEITIAGKGVFNSFLKSLTALGQKESKPNYQDCPEDFLIFYYFSNLDSNSVKMVFSRFKSLIRYINSIDYKENEVNLYFGIKCDGQFEYGMKYDDRMIPFGQFKLSKSVIKWITQLESKSAFSLKKELVNLSLGDIITLGRIKMDMKNFNPGYHEKQSYPLITDKVITFGYYGIGKWDNGKLDQSELLNLKNNFSTWILSKSWGGKVLISIQPQSFWLNIHLKLK